MLFFDKLLPVMLPTVRWPSLKMAAFSHNKFLPVVPCVVGYTYENDEKKARIFCWDKVSQKIQLLDGEMEFEKFNYVDAKGFKIASSGPNLVMSGGEYSFRNRIWQMTTFCIYLINYLVKTKS